MFNIQSVLPALLVLFVVSGLPLKAAHAFSWQPTPTQFALLPDHCKAKISDYLENRSGKWKHRFPINERKIQQYRVKIGNDFEHMHHYCAGLAYLSEAKSNPKRAKWLLERARAEMAYTIGRSDPAQPLWIEMNIAQAKAQAGLGKTDQALRQLRSCLELEPRSAAIYIEIARTQKMAGDINDAVSTLETGLANGGEAGPLHYWLALYYFDLGDLSKARESMLRAEAGGMTMSRLRKKLGSE
jgi:predicted Zn-dependent protease